jgi:mono/diheme cytochrome c family protein
MTSFGRNLCKTYFFVVIFLSFMACDADETKRKQYFANGAEKYKTHCANCHQENGAGLQKLYPPIAESDYLIKNKKQVICGMRYGMHDTLLVNGQKYTQMMPSNYQLYAIDIAEISTYIYNRWGQEKVYTDVKEVEKILATCPTDRR